MSYVKNLHKYKVDLEADLLKNLKKFYQNAHQEVSYDTPVDTGRAQASWWMVQPGGSARIREGGGVVNPPSLYWMTWKNSDVDLVNGNHYIKYLNEGWSQQAPSKFIERAISRAVRNAT